MILFMRNKGFLQLLTLLLLAASTRAQNPDSVLIKRISDEVLVNSTAYPNLRYLCKKVGPRLSGSANAKKAIDATAAMLRAAGADTVYLQPCMVTHWERGAKETGYVTLADKSKHVLKLTALGNSVGTAAAGISSTVIEVKNMAELSMLGEKVIKGKIVFFNIAMNPTYVKTFNAYGEYGVGRRSGPAQAAKYGAIGAIVRSLASNIDDHPHTGATQYNDSFPKIPAIAISTADAEWLSSELRKKMDLKAYFKTNCTMFPDAPSFNVIGEMKGSEFPAEIITVGGHLDSWDLAEGAHDDGTGCVQSIEVLRAMKQLQLRPKRTVRAVMFMNEENGGGGSKAYLATAKLKNEKLIFALESDEGGFTPRGYSLEMTDANMQKMRSWLPLLNNYGIYEMNKGGSGSDIEPLKQIGTPLAGYAPDSQRYFDYHHAETDVFEAVSKRELDLGAVNMTALVWLISEYGL